VNPARVKSRQGRVQSSSALSTGAGNIASLLLVFGVDVRVPTQEKGKPCSLEACPRRKLCRVTFWQRPIFDVQDAYRKARVNYLQRVKESHPDHGGDASETAYLNSMWKAVNRIFKARRLHVDQ
jgi:hypothetical protein